MFCKWKPAFFSFGKVKRVCVCVLGGVVTFSFSPSGRFDFKDVSLDVISFEPSAVKFALDFKTWPDDLLRHSLRDSKIRVLALLCAIPDGLQWPPSQCFLSWEFWEIRPATDPESTRMGKARDEIPIPAFQPQPFVHCQNPCTSRFLAKVGKVQDLSLQGFSLALLTFWSLSCSRSCSAISKDNCWACCSSSFCLSSARACIFCLNASSSSAKHPEERESIPVKPRSLQSQFGLSSG